MATTWRWCLVAAASCATSLLVAGCDNDDSGGSTSSEDAQAATGADEPSPLAQFLGWSEGPSPGGSEEFTEDQRQEHYQVQDYIVRCMEDVGFEYIPEPFPGDREPSSGEDSSPDLWALRDADPEAFTRQYGYGITTVDHEDQLIPIDDPELIEELIDPSGDPNLEYRASLSEEARREYDRTLNGYHWAERDAATAADDAVEADPSGCRYEAIVAVTGADDDGDDPPELADLSDAWDVLYRRIENDPRMAAAVRAWSDCMQAAGYPGLAELWAAEDQVRERQADLYKGDERSVQDGPDPAALADAREFELAIAWADFECRRSHEIDRIHREVQFDHEEQFIEDHRQELEAYRDWLNGMGP